MPPAAGAFPRQFGIPPLQPFLPPSRASLSPTVVLRAEARSPAAFRYKQLTYFVISSNLIAPPIIKQLGRRVAAVCLDLNNAAVVA